MSPLLLIPDTRSPSRQAGHGSKRRQCAGSRSTRASERGRSQSENASARLVYRKSIGARGVAIVHHADRVEAGRFCLENEISIVTAVATRLPFRDEAAATV